MEDDYFRTQFNNIVQKYQRDDNWKMYLKRTKKLITQFKKEALEEAYNDGIAAPIEEVKELVE